MKFLKVNADLAVNIRKIEALKVVPGRDEHSANINAYMDSGAVYRISSHEDALAAEFSLIDLIEGLEK